MLWWWWWVFQTGNSVMRMTRMTKSRFHNVFTVSVFTCLLPLLLLVLCTDFLIMQLIYSSFQQLTLQDVISLNHTSMYKMILTKT